VRLSTERRYLWSAVESAFDATPRLSETGPGVPCRQPPGSSGGLQSPPTSSSPSGPSDGSNVLNRHTSPLTSMELNLSRAPIVSVTKLMPVAKGSSWHGAQNVILYQSSL